MKKRKKKDRQPEERKKNRQPNNRQTRQKKISKGHDNRRNRQIGNLLLQIDKPKKTDKTERRNNLPSLHRVHVAYYIRVHAFFYFASG